MDLAHSVDARLESQVETIAHGDVVYDAFARRMMEIKAFLKSQDEDFQPSRIILVDRIAAMTEDDLDACVGHWRGPTRLTIVDPGPWAGFTQATAAQLAELMGLAPPAPSGHFVEAAGFDPDPDELF
ncbi:hypothetical protein [Cryobacterium lyxosi]|uniref:Uncharacterized protein n=1 Tax=Cryobacterium lyxosi TaxID=1259228 RepID=A0A4R8ZFS5_9MICO|nr:hypothetical protein [Cryobacterium lyxosi]TFD26632.1 hypothetical protein E3T27_07625 [Cryobacterium lyxosi]